jgi:hypothetical protein
MAGKGLNGVAGPTALVVIPKTVNYFNNIAGRRLAEALTKLGFSAEIHTLQTCPDREYDWCFLMSILELVVSYQAYGDAFERLAAVKRRCGRTATWLLECVETKWFEQSYAVCKKAKVDLVIDSAFETQVERLPTDIRDKYSFVFYGLTERERNAVRRSPPADTQRVIPWAFIGHLTSDRVDLVYRLVREVDPAGFVYLPDLEPVREDGPHINEEQLQQILEKTKYQFWCAHHPAFYMEGERFRRSILTGSLPIKIMRHPRRPDYAGPFSYLIFDAADFADQVRALDFTSVRQRFIEDYLRLPTLEESLAKFFRAGPAATSGERGQSCAPWGAPRSQRSAGGEALRMKAGLTEVRRGA